ncbi:MAG: anti-sigma factor antagonist [Clostridia bacterium]|nr:anti-sigma factor antagonist [Clostridia bacterium]
MLRSKPPREALTVTIAGELDHCAAPQIRRLLDDVLADPTVTRLTLDLENLTFMDSSGIGVLLGRLRTLQDRGGSMSVKNMQPPVDRLFRLSGLDRVISIEKKGGRK